VYWNIYMMNCMTIHCICHGLQVWRTLGFSNVLYSQCLQPVSSFCHRTCKTKGNTIRIGMSSLKNCSKFYIYWFIWYTILSPIDWLIIYCFTSRSRVFHLYGDVAITFEGLQNLGLCLALRAFEQGGIFIVPRLLWHGASVFPVSSEGPPHSVASFDTKGDVENLF
jgi:hypothetical protein